MVKEVKKFWIIFSDDHVTRMGTNEYRFKRFSTEKEAKQIAAKMAAQFKTRFHVLKQVSAFEPESPKIIEVRS